MSETCDHTCDLNRDRKRVLKCTKSTPESTTKSTKKSMKSLQTFLRALRNLTKKTSSIETVTKLEEDVNTEDDEPKKKCSTISNVISNLDNNFSRNASTNTDHSNSYINKQVNLVPTTNEQFMHSHSTNDCVLPDIKQITSLPFYWPIDRFKAEELLKDKPDGTYLLRKSSHSNFLFSVSFTRSNRTLHARIEKENGKFSFDSFDPDNQKFDSINELFENYKNNKCHIFEPILTAPLNNPTRHTLKQLSQYSIISMCNYHHINHLPIPRMLKDYLRNEFNYCSDSLK